MYSKILQTAFILIIISSVNIFSQGNVRGKVTDESKFSLIGANVFIEGLSKGAATDQSGDYLIKDLPAGSHELTVSFLGYQKKAVPFVIEKNKTTVINIQLEAGVILGDDILVIGERAQGQARALNQQKNNSNITNIVSADQIGRFPDQNIGDALKRIPSISVAYDQGEARFANVRGTEPRLNSFTINGERIPSAEAEIRSVQLDLVPSDMIQTIEVNKAVTPDMDADAIGGSVNLVTRQAPNDLRLSGTIGSGYNFLSEKTNKIGSFVAGKRFLNNKLGLMLNGSYFDLSLGSHNVEGEWDGDQGDYSLKEWQIRNYQVRRLRQSIGAAFDYQLSENHTLYLNTIYNHRNDWENRFRVVYEQDEDEDDDGNEIPIWVIERQTKGGIGNDVNDNSRLEDQRMWTASFAGDHKFQNGMILNWSAAMSKASEERPNERYIQWATEVPRSDVQVDLSDTETPLISERVPLSGFELNEITEEYQYTEEKDLNFKIDLLIPFLKEGKYKNELKLGGRYKKKNKERNNFEFFEYTPLSGFENLLSVGHKDYTDRNFLAGDYKVGVLTSAEEIGQLDLNNSSLFEKEDKPDEYLADNFIAEEKVTAGYIQLNQHMGDKLFIIAGVRLEQTNIDYTGNEFDEESGLAAPRNGKDDYLNVLPGFHVKYNLDENKILRFAWSNAISRPNYYDLVPYRSIAEDNEELAVGNPALDPTTSMNLDLMYEHYLRSVGILSAGLFYKQINDFIYIHSEDDFLDPVSGNTYDEYFQPRNGAEATLFGFEAAFQRRLDFLPGVMRNISVYTNYTYTYSKADNPQLNEQVEGDKDIELPGSAPHTFNASVNYEDGKLSLGLSFNYTSAYLDPYELDLTPGLERYYDAATYLDFNGSYSITNQLRFFVEANNLLNQPLRFYAGDSKRTFQAEYYNVRMNAGVKFDL